MGLVPAYADGFTKIEAARGYYVREICRYERTQNRWIWTCRIAADKRQHGIEEDAAAFTAFESHLRALSDGSAAHRAENPPAEERGSNREESLSEAGNVSNREECMSKAGHVPSEAEYKPMDWKINPLDKTVHTTDGSDARG
jgi:hypothetical protein